MNNRVVKILKGMPASDGAGVKLTRALGQPDLKFIDPFLMLDEIKSDDPNDYIAGFPPHPHRGFETLTYLMHGSMEHKDSTGGRGLIESGGVQYMTAGKGIIHSETPKQDKGLLWGFQLWINLHSSEKMVDASYVDIPKNDIPVLTLSNESSAADTVTVKVIAGQFNDHPETGPVKRQDIDMKIYDISAIKNSSVPIIIGANHQGYIYVYQGAARLDNQTINKTHIAQITQSETKTQLERGKTDDTLPTENPNQELLLELDANTGVLIALAEPIGEPIVQYGPFVMNTSSEIEQAIQDYQTGKLT